MHHPPVQRVENPLGVRHIAADGGEVKKAWRVARPEYLCNRPSVEFKQAFER
ncbi:hypothetical protein [Chitinimonas taiwanensis]|uniref:hypothetical protein n=1 Tax=Chitinimonas taiwanensis TaxID=240412 RepID=UPI000ABBBC1E|nr:hypothetical protein [Chitinimonas taiwanensis]